MLLADLRVEDNFKEKKLLGSTQQLVLRNVCGAHSFNVKIVSPTYIAHFPAQDFSHFLRVFLVGVLLLAP